MTSSPGSRPPLPPTTGDAGARALVAAMETAPAAIYVLSATSTEPVWANARARALGTHRDRLPVVGGRPLTDVLATVLRTGQPETVCGRLGTGGPTATVMVRPLRVEDGPGVLVVVESEDAVTDTVVWPDLPDDGVEKAQLSLLPPSLPLLPDLHLSGSYHRASTVEAAGATGTTRSPSARAGWRWSSGTPSVTASRPPAR